MAGVYENKFNGAWVLVEKDVLKKTTVKPLIQALKKASNKIRTAAKALDNAMPTRDSAKINRGITEVKNATADAEDALAKCSLDKANPLPSDVKQYLGQFRS